MFTTKSSDKLQLWASESAHRATDKVAHTSGSLFLVCLFLMAPGCGEGRRPPSGCSGILASFDRKMCPATKQKKGSGTVDSASKFPRSHSNWATMGCAGWWCYVSNPSNRSLPLPLLSHPQKKKAQIYLASNGLLLSWFQSLNNSLAVIILPDWSVVLLDWTPNTPSTRRFVAKKDLNEAAQPGFILPHFMQVGKHKWNHSRYFKMAKMETNCNFLQFFYSTL